MAKNRELVRIRVPALSFISSESVSGSWSDFSCPKELGNDWNLKPEQGLLRYRVSFNSFILTSDGRQVVLNQACFTVSPALMMCLNSQKGSFSPT